LQVQQSYQATTTTIPTIKTTTTIKATLSNPPPPTINSYYYRNSLDALYQISKTEGLRGLYKGYGATLASFGPFSALYFTFYEQMKYWAQQYISKTTASNSNVNDNNLQPSKSINTRRHVEVVDKDIVLPFYLTLVCSCGAGAFASWLTSPLDMAKLRLQVQRGARATAAATAAAQPAATIQTTTRITLAHNQQHYPSNMISCLQYIYYNEGGVRGLFRGAGARVLHFAPATTITMTLYETCRSWILHNTRMNH
jgi:Mitochondrial carrier protein